jgi:hypothetical protein
MRESLTLHSLPQARADLAELWPLIVDALRAGKRLVLSIKSETRSTQENALLHAMLTHISKHQQWAGKKHSVETWKRLLTAAWCRARGEHIELLPALDGHGVDIVFRRTSELTVAECAELIEFVFAWGAANDVRFPPDPRQIEPTAVRRIAAKKREEVAA